MSLNQKDLLEIGGTANHVHLLVEISNLDHYTSLLRAVKASSTSWLKQNYPEAKNFGWQDGYGSYSASFSQIDNIRNYIKNQEEHHKKLNFEQEYLKFLNACEVSYDKRYVFDEDGEIK